MNKLFLSILGGLVLLLLAACSAEDFEDQQSSDGLYVYELRLDGGVQDYSDATRAAKVWKNGDVIYLRFSTNSGTVLGTASYSSGKWILATDNALTGSGSCQAVKIDNASSSNSSTVTLSSQSAVYEDRSGTWSLSGNTLNVRATLNPLLGRLRFKGTSGTSFSLTGLTTYTSYSISNGTFAQSSAPISGSITSTGYSNYIYGLIANTSNPTLVTNGFIMECPTTMMQAGQSGWLNYPTATSHTGWIENPYNSHEYVDLGLSVKWATCNVGASSPEDYGDYYAWGEIETNTYGGWRTYKWCSNGSWTGMTKYTYPDGKTSGIWYSNGTFVGDNKTTLDPEDDVAHVKWGGDWRMPTKAEQDELRDTNNCTWTWTTQGGKNGYLVISKKNGKSIFLPAAGYHFGSSLNYAGARGYYWSSSLGSSLSHYACSLLFYSYSDYVGSYYEDRYYGHSVRPVCP